LKNQSWSCRRCETLEIAGRTPGRTSLLSMRGVSTARLLIWHAPFGERNVHFYLIPAGLELCWSPPLNAADFRTCPVI
jgi:hypothetical protein